MTRYTVVWVPELQNELLEYWIAGGGLERRFITEVADEIDRTLAVSGGQRGNAVANEPGVSV